MLQNKLYKMIKKNKKKMFNNLLHYKKYNKHMIYLKMQKYLN